MACWNQGPREDYPQGLQFYGWSSNRVGAQEYRFGRGVHGCDAQGSANFGEMDRRASRERGFSALLQRIARQPPPKGRHLPQVHQVPIFKTKLEESRNPFAACSWSASPSQERVYSKFPTRRANARPNAMSTPPPADKASPFS